METHQADAIEAFKRFDAYKFANDDNFQVSLVRGSPCRESSRHADTQQSGLQSILAADSKTTPEVIQMAKIFYYSKYANDLFLLACPRTVRQPWRSGWTED